MDENITEKSLSNTPLREGGLGGHMSHLHEDISLTFGDLKTIFRTLASHKNTIQVQEKVDGQNVFFPLNSVSSAILEEQPQINEYVFPYNRYAFMSFFYDKAKELHQALS